MTYLLGLTLSLASVFTLLTSSETEPKSTPAETIEHVATAEDITARITNAFTFDDLYALRSAAQSRGIKLEFTEISFGDYPREGFGDLKSISIAVAYEGMTGTARSGVDNNRSVGFHVDTRTGINCSSPFGVGDL